jgi:Uncharacterised nucleotidyltransferase
MTNASPPRPNALQMHNTFEFLCDISAAHLSPERIARIKHSNLSEPDWACLLHVAELHGVLPLAARNLIEHAQHVPPAVQHNLRSAYDENLKRSLWFTAELARIMRHFERARLRAIPYKGPLLAESVYHDVALRNFHDLDFLISAADFKPAERALSELGYRPATNFTPAVERFWLRHGNERTFDGVAGKNLVELQWALLPNFYAIDLPVSDLLRRAAHTVVGGYDMPSLSPEDSFLALCIHAAKHLWTRLIWLVDIAETLRNTTSDNTNMDYERLFSRAQDLGIARILAVNFWLVKNLLRMNLPQPAEELIAADPRVPNLGREFADRLASGATYNFETTEYLRLILKLRERRADRWRSVWRLFWTPGQGDLAAVQLPGPLFPLYRAVRIARLMRKLTVSLLS